MQLETPKYIDPNTKEEALLLTFDEYKEKIGFPLLPSPTLDYQIEHGNLDFIRLGKYRYIVYNSKAQNYKPGSNYGKRWKNNNG